jgi:hypothetical protein
MWHPSPEEIMESYLLGIRADPLSREVALDFRSPRGAHAFGLRAYEVEALDLNDFVHQNIVFEVRVMGRGSDPQVVVDLLADVLFRAAAASDVVADTQVLKLKDRTTAVLEGRQVLVELEPVYGASLVLLAGSLEWHH